MTGTPRGTTRRRFLQQTVGFSAVALLGGRPILAAATEIAAPLPASVSFFSVGDFGVEEGDLPRQKGVSDGMVRYIKDQKITPDALMLLGDNFYRGLRGKGVKSPRWEMNIERMYPPDPFKCPMYAMLGNHDYSDEPKYASVKAQLAYKDAVPASRWVMPSKYYSFLFPAKNPIATFIVLDTNLLAWAPANVLVDEREAQDKWLHEELAKPRETPWLFMMGHHPLYSDGNHGDNGSMIKFLDAALRKHKVDMYLAGHDHDLQHIEFGGHPTSSIVSGAGGAGGARARPAKSHRGPFHETVYGFTHFDLSPDRFSLRHVDANGKVLHTAEKTKKA